MHVKIYNSSLQAKIYEYKKGFFIHKLSGLGVKPFDESKRKTKKIRMDNGPEFIAKVTPKMSKMHDIAFKYNLACIHKMPLQSALMEVMKGV